MALFDRRSPRRLALLASFAVVFLLGGAVFASTALAHVAVLQSDGVSGTVVGGEFASDTVIEVEVAITNPTVRSITVTRADFSASLDDQTVARSVPVAVGRITVPSGGRETFNVSFRVLEEYRSDERLDAIRKSLSSNDVVVRGIVTYRIVRTELTVDVIDHV